MAFAPSKGKKHGAEGGSGRMELNMTSLIDMFTCLLAFLLKSFSAEGALVTPSSGLTLPNSTAGERAKPGLTIEIGQNGIVVEGVHMADNAAEFGKTDFQTLLKSPMYADLDRRHKAALAMEEYGSKFEGEVIIQGDKQIPFSALYKVMFLCARNDYGKMRLIVISSAE